MNQSRVNIGENLCIAGLGSWTDLTFQVKLRMLTDSMNPPEGGTILYFRFKNIKNYYSFHLCLPKQKVEFIKRVRGIWTTVAEHDYDFETRKDYSVAITTDSEIHECQIDGTSLIVSHCNDIAKGCIGIGAKYCDVEFNYVSVSLPSRSRH